MSHVLVNGKKKYLRNIGENYQPRNVITVNEEDICPLCQWPLGTKKLFIHPDNTITHDRSKCRDVYAAPLALLEDEQSN